MTPNRCAGVFCGLLAVCGASRANGQNGQTAPASPSVCRGEVISRIDVHSQPPFPLGGPWFVSRVASLVTSRHSTTKESIVRRYLILQAGRPCNELDRLESERILRAQPFFASATVAAVPDTNGTVIIDVTTVDEISLVIDANVAAQAPVLRTLHLGEANLDGEAVYLAGAWDYSQFYRDVYKGRLTDYQFLGHPYRFSLEGIRNEFGGSWDGEISSPFLTETQSNSWRITAGSNNGYLSFIRPEALTVSLRSERAYEDIGGVHAFGPVRRRILIGGSFSRERERTAHMPVIVLDSGIFQDTTSVLFNRYDAHQSSRLNLLLGYRDVQFMTVKGFDSPEGTQDVRTGFQVATLFGRGIKISSADERDYFVSGDLYAGAGSPTSFVAFETMGERRRDFDSHQWDGILGSGRAAWYVQPAEGNTFISDVEFSGGGRVRVPFQLTFANPEGGLMGYGSSHLGGGERLITRL
ncbi:MAG TPA: hypothetical protein VNU46_08910, partial [Gemmatimonadaceae bacterium]|nr:hypothetical protein [Gemmatimonadaceae bacterium]